MKSLLLLLFTICLTGLIQAQTVTGTVIDSDNSPLIGVNVYIDGTNIGTTTDLDGKFTINVEDSNAILIVTYIGYQTQEIPVNGQSEISILLEQGLTLGEVQVVGTRSYKRSSTDSPVAIDVINVEEIVAKSGQVEVNQFLQYAAPSFNATKQSGADGADHIDPATLRGLGPDQTLVLLNGKRRHQSSLVNIFGSRGRGNSGTDLNAIPATSIKRIEILRDGASAQYGSDAIAGVMNIVLKDGTDKLTGSYTVGGYNPSADGDFAPGTPNTDGNYIDTDGDGVQLRDGDPTLDGISHKIGLNYGFKVLDDGFINMTAEYLSKNKTLRPGASYRRGMGEAAIDGFNYMVNAAIPISKNTEMYAYGGSNYRDTDAYAFTRNLPTERAVVQIYPNGFTPRITSIIKDNSITAGVRTVTDSGWNIDFSNTYGKNNFHYFIKGTNNASLGAASPTDMDAGGHQLSQNTSGLTFSKYLEEVGNGLNIAFGTEFRRENFSIFAGEPASYGTFDVDGLLVQSPTQSIPIDPITNAQRPGGSQGFPGYAPANVVDRDRSNFAVYTDLELDVTEQFLVSGAARYERYSDFGRTFNVKAATRVKANENLVLRGSISTGFRAPSLAQIYYNLQFTAFEDGALSETLLAANNSNVAREFGIPQLKEETAFNAAAGFTFNQGNFTATIDGYYIDINDRVVLTGYFNAPNLPEVDAAAFFVNAVDTRTYGLDVVLSYRSYLANGGRFGLSFAGNFNDLDISQINNPNNLDSNTLFSSREQTFLKASAPPSKLNLVADYSINGFDAKIALTRFSSISLDSDDDPSTPFAEYGSKYITDVTLGYQLNTALNISIGTNNIFNIYPSQQDPDTTDGGGYWDSVQMGFSGAYYFAKLGFSF